MNKNALVSIFAILLMAMSSTVIAVGSGEVADSQRVVITLLNQDPDPVAPGNFVDLRFKFENYGLKEAADIEVQLLNQGPFTLVDTSERVQDIGTLSGRQTSVDGRIIKYRIKVSPDATQGEQELKLQYRIAGGAWFEPDAFTVTVEESSPLLAVVSAKTDPARVMPGADATLTLEFQNLAQKDIKDITVDFQVLTTTTLTTSVSRQELPFSPLGTTNELILEHLSARAKKSLDFDFTVDPSAEIKVYKLPVAITYSDYSGNSYSTTKYVTIVVEAKPDLTVTVDESTVDGAGQTGDVTLKFVNKGLDDVKFVDLFLKETDKFTLLSPAEVYVGNIDSDDYETADYTIYLKEDCCADDVKLPLTMTYRDVSNRLYTINPEVSLRIFSAEEQDLMMQTGESSSIGWIIVLIIVVGGIFGYRWYRKRKKAK